MNAVSRQRPAAGSAVAAAGGTARAVVVGGGLAGISAAVALADRGWRVTVLETRPRLGGAACSFDRAGMRVDTGAHVVLRCYHAYRGLLERMGVTDLLPIQQRMSITVLRPGAAPATLRRGRLGPAPLHLVPALAGYRELSVRERLSAARAALAIRRLDLGDPAVDGLPLAAWLRAHGQNDHLIEALWGLLCVAALNIDPARASTGLMARVLRTGLLEQVSAGDIAVPAAPLSDLHDAPARRLLARLRVEVRTGVKVTSIQRAGSAHLVVTRGGEVPADAVVCAVPHGQAALLVPADAAPDGGGWAELDASPIVNVHLRFDRVVTADLLGASAFAAVLGSPLQWVFDRTAAAGAQGQYLVSSVSAAEDAIGRPASELLGIARRELQLLFPAAAGARLLDGFVTREPRATFRQQAGSAAYRPAARTAWPGLALAGSWTDTGLPDTLEGAVRSGLTAAEVLAGRPGAAASRPAGGPGRLPGAASAMEVMAR